MAREKAKIVKKKRPYDKERFKTDLFCYALLLVPIWHYVTFWVVVNINSFFLPFQDDITGAFTLKYFDVIFQAFQAGGELLLAFKNTMIFFVSGLFTSYVLSLSFAYFLYKKILFHRFFTVAFMIPSMISSVVLISVFKSIIGIDGPLAVVYNALTHKELPPLLYQESTAIWTIVVYCIWCGFGMNLILFSGAMAKIPPEINEAAELDGIGYFGELTKIVIPLIAPTIMIMLLFSAMGFLSADGPILLFTEGMYGTKTIGYWFYENIIVSPNYGLSSAFGLLMSLASAPLVIICQILRHKVPVIDY